MTNRPPLSVALFRARVAILLVWHGAQLCVWLLARLVVLMGVLWLIVLIGIAVFEMLGVPPRYLISN